MQNVLINEVEAKHLKKNEAARFWKQMMLREFSAPSLTNSSDFKHISTPGKVIYVKKRKIQVAISRLRCRIPSLNLYLHKTSPHQFVMCRKDETIEHLVDNLLA